MHQRSEVGNNIILKKLQENFRKIVVKKFCTVCFFSVLKIRVQTEQLK